MSQQSPPEPARGLGVFSQADAAPGNLSYAPFGGFSTAPPPPERAAVSALGGAEFIPRTSSAGSFGGIGIVQDDAPPRNVPVAFAAPRPRPSALMVARAGAAAVGWDATTIDGAARASSTPASRSARTGAGGSACGGAARA